MNLTLQTLMSVFFLILSVLPADAEQLLAVKYRDTPVDVDKPHFEAIDTSESSWIRGAWYDKSNLYMIINLEGTNYHYCGLTAAIWERFKSANSFGTEYNNSIKGNFDCRVNSPPAY